MLPTIAAALVTALLQAPADAEAVFRDAIKALSTLDYARALTEFDRAIRLDPKNVKYYLARGRTLVQLNRLDEAIATCTTAIALDSLDTRALVDRGHYYLNLHKIDLGLADLMRVEAMRTDTVVVPLTDAGRIFQVKQEDFQLWFHLGLARYLDGQFAAAAGTFDKCIRTALGSQASSCKGWQYLALRRAGRQRDAQKLLDGVYLPRPDSKNPGVLTRDILLLFKALAADTDPSTLMPTDSIQRATAAYNIGIWHLLNGRPVEAQSYFEQAAAAPSDPRAFGAIAADAELKRMKRL